MPDYQKLYTKMFNAATDALEALDAWNIGLAEEFLRCAQQEAEDVYMNDESAVLRRRFRCFIDFLLYVTSGGSARGAAASSPAAPAARPPPYRKYGSGHS